MARTKSLYVGIELDPYPSSPDKLGWQLVVTAPTFKRIIDHCDDAPGSGLIYVDHHDEATASSKTDPIAALIGHAIHGVKSPLDALARKYMDPEHGAVEAILAKLPADDAAVLRERLK